MDAASTTVGVIGLGYVGLPTAIGFLDAGFEVWALTFPSGLWRPSVRPQPHRRPGRGRSRSCTRDAPLARHHLDG